MTGATGDDPVIERLGRWADAHDDVLALLLTSTRAIPGATVDALSDYDVIVVVRDTHPWVADRAWLGDFGDVLIAWWDPVELDPETGAERTGAVVQYTDGLKIDFSLWPATDLEAIAATATLPAELDAGYRVIRDRTGLTATLPGPTVSAYRPVPPDATRWEDVTTGFLVGAPYVAKCLVRGDLLPARWCLDVDMIHTYLVPMLQWWVGCQHGWSRPVGNLGKGLRAQLPADLWREIEAIWAVPGPDGHAVALFRTMALFRRVGIDVGQHLGLPYPTDQHDKVVAFTRAILTRP